MTKDAPPTLSPVSAVIPSYRSHATLERAVDSILRQTMPPHELIIVDDASDDETPALLYRLQQQLTPDWLKVILLNQNRGPSVARNMGWEAATQPFVAFLDADDAWHPKKLEVQYHWMQAYPHIVLTGHPRPMFAPSQRFETLPTQWHAWNVTPWQLLLSNRFTPSAVMLKRTLPQRFEEGKNHLEDFQLWLEIALAGQKMALLDLPLAAMFKPAIGYSGLSGDRRKMRAGEIAMYHALVEKQLLSPLAGFACQTMAAMKAPLRWIRHHKQ